MTRGAILLLCLSTSAFAAPPEYHVRTSDELEVALQKAEPGATIWLREGHYTGPLQLEKDVTLRGEAASPPFDLPTSENVVIDAEHHGPVVMVAPDVHVSLERLTLRGGKGFGAAIVSRERSTLGLQHVVLTHNVALPYALVEVEGTVTTYALIVKDNNASFAFSLGKNGRADLQITHVDNSVASFATLCKSSKVAIDEGILVNDEGQPFAYLLDQCPTLTSRIDRTEAKLVRSKSAHAFKGELAGRLTIQDSVVNDDTVNPRSR